MKRIILLYILLCPFFAVGQVHLKHVTYLTKDSIPYNLEEKWKFLPGAGDISMAARDYNDLAWEIVNPALYRSANPKHDYQRFNGEAWLRLHVHIDSSLTMRPLAIGVKHFGASEIYLDGKKIVSYGIVAGKESSVYEDPQNVPLPLMIQDTGEHVFAVKYANYNAEKNNRLFFRNQAGFFMKIALARSFIENDHAQSVILTAILVFLFGIFIALSLLHLFLYLYYRKSTLNLYFSLFTFSLAVLFFVPFVNRVTSYPERELYNLYVILFFSVSACFSLSGFNNELFSKNKLRFYILTACCILAPVLWFVDAGAGMTGYISLIAIVMLESVILVVRAIYRRVKGARIIGVGILFFALFFLTIICLVVALDSFDVNDSTTSGKIFELFMAGAVLSMPISMSAYLAWNFSSINKDLKAQLQQVQLLSEKNLLQEQEKKQMLESRQEELEQEVALRTEEVVAQKQEIELQHTQLKVEKRKSDDLLLNILPEEVAEELKQKGTSEAKFFDHVTVLFTDFVNFTSAGERMSPQELVDELHTCFKKFDEISSKHNIEKIKTIGDAYLAVCGLPMHVEHHAANVVYAAIEIGAFIASRKAALGDKAFDIRMGIHSGSVVAGIVGVKKFAYDIWGDTVNTAARMEQNSETGKINISQTTFDLIKDQFECTYRGEIAAKNKGAMSMYFIEHVK